MLSWLRAPRRSTRWPVLLAALGLVGALPAQRPADTLGPDDEFVRELAPSLASGPDFGRAAIDAIARRYAERDQLDLTSARILAHRKLAAFEVEQKHWANAAALLQKAIEFATTLEDAPLLIELHLANVTPWDERGDRGRAATEAREAWDLAARIQRPDLQTEAGLRLTAILQIYGAPEEADTFYEAMLKLPRADPLRIELARASQAVTSPTEQRPLWERVRDLARSRSDRPTEARALVELARERFLNDAPADGLALFNRARALDPDQPRSPIVWHEVSKAHRALGDIPAARAAIERALAATDVEEQPGYAADIEDERASILAELGDHAAAYAALRRAESHRAARAAASLRPAMIRMVPNTNSAERGEAAELAAVRAALRESELTEARLRQRLALGAGAAALLLAAALAIAYAYKRRAAAALATARDAAELRAERTHWQMLRYQLNPHFLFNALASLSGLVVTDPAAARRVVARLSEFCRLALQRTSAELRTVDEEVHLLQTFLEVEQAGAGDRLTVRFEIDPPTRTALLPPLLLQPLVENALKYGEGPDDDQPLEIIITTRHLPDTSRLQVEVANTGAWIDPATRRRQRRDGGVGLANVRDRLARLPGGGGHLTPVLDQAGWVRLQVDLPLLEPTETTSLPTPA